MAKQRPAPAPDPFPKSDDALAFRAAVRDVKPLPATPLPSGVTQPPPRARRRARAAARDALAVDMPLIDSLPLADTPALPAITGADALTFQRGGVQIQVMRKLRRGLYPIEDQLDLHGLSQATARVELAHFLWSARAAGQRCVRIIHGKGYRSGTRGPILKIAVDLWLRRHLDVIAFTSARAIDGGTGALYVLLRA